MRSIPRRIAAAAIVAGGLILITAPAAHAVLDPVGVITCLASSAPDVSGVVDPASPGVPTEVPGMSCLQP
ncbi:hypothetical protein ABGB18_15010 [Nonomuraea sp. B12E4]|uniref:hypothetical protein n=1 Tax=Nonomuraea sp. B12E4 TaxID=3153564 RepID=UPI00325C4337